MQATIPPSMMMMMMMNSFDAMASPCARSWRIGSRRAKSSSTRRTDKLADDVAYEIARYGDSQIHAVGAVLGGIASQELIKIITGQYLPMTKPLVYDAVSSTMATLF